MRSIFLPRNISQGTFSIDKNDSNYHHLSRVVKVKVGEKILILNGRGETAISEIKVINSQSIIIETEVMSVVLKKINIDVALGMPKKEYFEDVVRICTEAGISNLYPINSKYSQYEYSPNDRLSRIVESSMVQSNNPWMLGIDESINSFDLLKEKFSNYQHIFVFSSQSKIDSELPLPRIASTDKVLIIVGPEGGFSQDELLFFEKSKLTIMELPTPILKTITAAAISIGWVLGRIY